MADLLGSETRGESSEKILAEEFDAQKSRAIICAHERLVLEVTLST